MRDLSKHVRFAGGDLFIVGLLLGAVTAMGSLGHVTYDYDSDKGFLVRDMSKDHRELALSLAAKASSVPEDAAEKSMAINSVSMFELLKTFFDALD